MIFRQLFDPQSSTYTYLLADATSREALLIDPVFEQARRDAALLEELGLRLKLTLETHVHADHITGAWLLKQKLGSRIAVAATSGAEGADLYLRPSEQVAFGKQHLEARATPGHTGGCTTYVLDDRSTAFTGDALFNRGCGRLASQQADEFNGPLGHVPGARLVPLGSLMKRTGELQKEKPVVTVCRSGARSAQATVLLGKAGFERVANLSGGMLRWRAQRFSVEGGTD